MCGIVGFKSNNYSKDRIIKMTNAIKHRGPDANGFYLDEKKGIGLGHRRLSIIDLSKAANQPMYSKCKKFVVIFNGEIYNYKEIALKIGLKNWKTNSDTEVILEAYIKWGLDFIKELNGMFAICIYDKTKDALYLIRDRMGIKPLYYYHKNNEFIFASEIKSIREDTNNLSVDYSTVKAYLHLGYIPNNNSIFKEIKKVPKGSFLIIKGDIIKEKSFWKNDEVINTKRKSSYKHEKNNLKKILTDSINKRLISDVPIGTFLSGGTDSSLVTSISQEISEKPVNTFSIGFKESKYNESKYAKKIAKYLKTNHYEFFLSENEAINQLESIINHFDEPFADSSALPTMMVSKMAKEHVSVCLSGDGGDELFSGYGSYKWAKRLNNIFIWNFRNFISKYLSYSKENQKKRAALVLKCPSINWKSHIFSQEQYLFSENEISELLIDKSKSSIISFINEINPRTKNLNPQESQAFFDLNNYLVDDLLVKVDRASMYSSLEVRVPLLDHRIVEYSLNLPFDYKEKNGIQKYILKDILYDYVPSNLMERPKWGFSIPLEKWLKTDLNYLISKYLNKETIEENNIMNYDYVKNLISRFNSGESYLYNRIWALIVLNKFLIKNV